MKVHISLNKLLLFEFILYLIIFKVYSDDCVTHSFIDVTYPKGKTLDNGYQIMITAQGIFSFDPELSTVEYAYFFTESQKFSLDVYNMNNTINQVEISQFSDEEGGQKLVVLYAKNYVYIMTEFGELMFFQELENKVNTKYTITLVAYKYLNGIYYFIIGHNIFNSSNVKCSFFYYYKIINQNQIELEYSNEVVFDSANELLINPISCQAMTNPLYQKVLTCFYNVNYPSYYLLVAMSLNPDNHLNIN